jgi:hypothetical protein
MHPNFYHLMEKIKIKKDFNLNFYVFFADELLYQEDIPDVEDCA